MSDLTSRKHSIRATLSLLAALALAWPAGGASAQSADTILFNGKILTVDKDFSAQEALAIGHGQVLATVRRPPSNSLPMARPG